MIIGIDPKGEQAVALERHLQQLLDKFCKELESDCAHDKTCTLRGRIRMLRSLIKEAREPATEYHPE